MIKKILFKNKDKNYLYLYHLNYTIYIFKVGIWCLMPLSTIFISVRGIIYMTIISGVCLNVTNVA
jgi:hypothetical protein